MTENIETIKFTYNDDSGSKMRLDKFLASKMSDFSRERIKKIIEEGHVWSQSTPEKSITSASYKVREGETLCLNIPQAKSLDVQAENLPLDILYEDEHLIVVNKAAGMSVHPSGPIVTGTLVNTLLFHCKNLSGIGGVERPGIVHRLDKGTSGVMVVAKNDKTHTALSQMFSDRIMERYYLALCYGHPVACPRRIETLIGRHPKDRKKMAVIDRGGKEAITTYEILESYGEDAALLKFKLHTGRTHQIRVHAAHLGHPLIGDPVYGKRKKLKNLSANELISTIDHQMLHATILGFNHPITGVKLFFETHPPKDMQELINSLSSQ